MKIAVYGASGYTGRLVAAELARRKIDGVLSGRNHERLLEVARDLPSASLEVRPAGVDDPSGLIEAFHGCDAVINCAGPFGPIGERVVQAAIAAGSHYVDTSAEQSYISRVFEACARDAQQAGVTVIPAMGYDIVPGDLIAHLTGKRVEPVQRLTLGIGTPGFEMTRGSMRSALLVLQGGDLLYEDGDWRRAGLRTRSGSMVLPGRSRKSQMMRFPGGEIITVPRHVKTRRLDVVMRADAFAPRALAFAVPSFSPLMSLLLRTPVRGVLGKLINGRAEGPPEDRRRAASFDFVAEAVGLNGERARGVVEGSDVYGISAVIAVEGARRLVANGAPAGVLAPAEAFDAADFLDFLAAHGVRWRVEATEHLSEERQGAVA